MSLAQNKAYFQEFDAPLRLKSTLGLEIRGIGCTQHAIGSAIVTIPFVNLDFVIEVVFLIVDTTEPTLLSLRDMIENGLDISIQN